MSSRRSTEKPMIADSQGRPGDDVIVPYKESKKDIAEQALGAIHALAKEVAGFTDVPGLKLSLEVAGWIAQNIGAMQDNKESFAELLEDCKDLTITVASLVIRTKYAGRTIPLEFKTKLESFERTVDDTQTFVKKLMARGRFMRFFFALVDQERISGLKERLFLNKTNLLLFMTMDLYVGLNNVDMKGESEVTTDETQEENPAQQMIQNPGSVDLTKLSKHFLAQVVKFQAQPITVIAPRTQLSNTVTPTINPTFGNVGGNLNIRDAFKVHNEVISGHNSFDTHNTTNYYGSPLTYPQVNSH